MADQMEVYPRVCGGTAIRRLPHWRTVGLSPRVRGNLAGMARRCRHCGSIPACAGEPCRLDGGHPPRGVYPRVCGGTSECIFRA